MRVAVAGGSGFLGRFVTSAAAAAGHEPLPFGREGLAAALAARPGPVDAVVWAAGRRSNDPEALRRDHVEAPLAALEHGPDLFVYLGSGELYGPAPLPFREDGTLLGRTAYAEAKRRAEGALADRAASLGVRLTVLRPAVVYGPGQEGPMFLPSLLAALREARPFAMTSGSQTRDFLHVSDLARLVLLALAPGAPAGVFNAGTGVETSLLAAARLLACAFAASRGVPAEPLLSLLRPGSLPDRPGDTARYVLDPVRSRAAFGFDAEVSLQAGLAGLAGGAAGGG